MDAAQFKEGIEYAETNYTNPNSFSRLDKELIQANFDLKGKDVLDFGCGMGHMSLWFAKQMGAKVDGVDIDENHLIIAQELNKKYQVPNVHFSLQNIITSPIEKQYDFIFLNDVIEHIISDWVQNVLDVLILNNLKPGGIIFFSYPPWEGPHAGHLQPATKIPWVHFLPHSMVLKIIERKNTQLVGRHNLLEHYLELNHMSHKKLTGLLKKYNLKQVFRKSHTKFNNIPFLKDTNFNVGPFKYIVTKELIAFQKSSK